MSDPYQILGVSPSASDDEVKTAYRQLARKYHPDNYVDNPLADLATEKMKEVNEAYDEIQRRRKGGSSQSSQDRGSYQGYGQSRGGYSQGQGQGQGYGNYQSGGQSGQPSQFDDIRRLIQNGRLPEAEELLDGIPQQRRDGEWNYLMGTIFYSKGWLDSAINYYTAACRLSPGNMEYRAAYQQLMQQRQYGSYTTGSASCCQTCATIYCCSSCCQCFGAGC